MPSDLEPRYPVVGGAVEHGYGPLAAGLQRVCTVLAIDGPAAAPWTAFIGRLTEAARAIGIGLRTMDARDHFAPCVSVGLRSEPVERDGGRPGLVHRSERLGRERLEVLSETRLGSREEREIRAAERGGCVGHPLTLHSP